MRYQVYDEPPCPPNTTSSPLGSNLFNLPVRQKPEAPTYPRFSTNSPNPQHCCHGVFQPGHGKIATMSPPPPGPPEPKWISQPPFALADDSRLLYHTSPASNSSRRKAHLPMPPVSALLFLSNQS
ncbi:hypothetical protein P280DRAFT_472306 [Massarina eburnea CBS 473.64]|uniref:Uncharacterized protein n=1 Tax=Massarina eburnea CBS 473.64 TaxID=1395130 RepID=A0A6A6RR82_9PLEO|nr:hypothetical protein P280DRAFT_472306 [Massarina eburnea CBS 473.64]